MSHDDSEFVAMGRARILEGRTLLAYAPAGQGIADLRGAAVAAGRGLRSVSFRQAGARTGMRPVADAAVLDLATSVHVGDVGHLLGEVASFRFAAPERTWRARLAALVDAVTAARAALGQGRPGIDDVVGWGMGTARAMSATLSAASLPCPEMEAFLADAPAEGSDDDRSWERTLGSELRRILLHWDHEGQGIDAFPGDGRPRISVPGLVSGDQVLLMDGEGPEARRCVRIILGLCAREARRFGLAHPFVLLHRGANSRAEGPFASLHAEAEGLAFLKRGNVVSLAPAEDGAPVASSPPVPCLPASVEALPGGDALALGNGGFSAVLWSGDDPSVGLAFDVDASGWCVPASLALPDGSRLSPAARSGLASDLRSGRASLLDGPSESWAAGGLVVEPSERWPLDVLAGEEGASDFAHPGALARVAGLLDLPLLRACAAGPMGARLHAAAAGDGPRRDFVVTWGPFGALLRHRSVEEVVRGGGRTVPVVAAMLGTDRARARRLVGRDSLPAPWLAGVRAAIRHGAAAKGLPYLNAIDPNLLPGRGDAAAWAGLVHCVDALDHFLERLHEGNVDEGVAVGLVMRCGSCWEARARRIGEDLGRYEDATDMVVGLARLVRAARPAALPDSTLASLRLFAGWGSLAAIAEASARWHAHPVLPHVHDGGAASLPEGTAWPPLFEGEVDLGGGWRARCLSGVGALRDEGASAEDAEGVPGLAHCVLSYAVAAAEGRCHIVSVRGPGGRESTAELVPHADGDHPVGAVRMRLAQHRGRRNAVPPREAERRLLALLAGLADGSVVHRADAMVPRILARDGDPVARDLDGILELWGPMLPPAWRGVGFDGIVSRLGRGEPALAG